MGGGKGGKVTVGYHYYMNVHFAIAHGGVDELHEIRIGDRVAWRGNLTGSSSAAVSMPNLFGGEKREGGVIGTVDFMTGGQTQPVNPSLRSAINQSTGVSDIPAYRGISTIFFKGSDGVNMNGTPWDEVDPGTVNSINSFPPNPSVSDFFNLLIVSGLARSSFLWGAMNPYFKTPSFLVRRVWKGWYSSKARIGDDVNPIHIIYECLLNKVWGLGYPFQDIDDTSFRAAADIMFNEGFGLSLKWTSQTSIEEFIKLICEHINATMVEDRQTGKWRMIMVRDNYNINNLFELNESNCTVEEFQRKTMGETINEVVVAYTRPEDGETDTVTVQNLANFSITGQINSQKKDYPGIRSPEMAFRVALRDLNTLSKPIAKFTIKCNRSIVGHYPGDVVKVNWPRLGLNGIPVRIGTMNLGNLVKGEIQIEAVEDVFGLPSNSYVDRQPIGWVDAGRNAEPVTEQKPFELTYYELYTSTTSADRLDWPTDVGFVAVSSLAPNNDANNVVLYDNIGGVEVGQGEFTPQLSLTNKVGYSDSTLNVDFTDFDVTQLSGGGLAYLGDELVELTSFNFSSQTVTVNRGMVDTVPSKHSVGEKLWFYGSNDYVLDNTDRVEGETTQYKLLPETSRDKLEIAQAPVINYVLQNRQLRPYRPGNLKFNGGSYPSWVGSPFVVSWSHRDRIQELLTTPTLFSMGNIGPEPGVTYDIVIKDEDNTVVGSATGLTGTTYSYATEMADLNKYELAPTGIFVHADGSTETPSLRFNSVLRVELKSVRDGLDSHQSHIVEVERAGYGYNYGNAY